MQTFREPVSDYQVLREKAASQRRDVERALTRFMAKTGETQSLFKDDLTTFPCKDTIIMWILFCKLSGLGVLCLSVSCEKGQGQMCLYMFCMLAFSGHFIRNSEVMNEIWQSKVGRTSADK